MIRHHSFKPLIAAQALDRVNRRRLAVVPVFFVMAFDLPHIFFSDLPT